MEATWNEDRRDRLETLYRAGLSFRRIADDIGVTRSAVIGKAHRLKLPKRIEVFSVREVRVRSPSKRPRRRATVAGMTHPIIPVPAGDPGREYQCSIYELRDNTCRWPLWDVSAGHEQRFYCGFPGASFAAGNPYCRHHSALCGRLQQ